VRTDPIFVRGFWVLRNAGYLFSLFVIPCVSHTLVAMVTIITVLCEEHADAKETVRVLGTVTITNESVLCETCTEAEETVEY